MFISLYSKLVNLSPSFRKASKRFLYRYMARKAQQANGWKFMNYGYFAAPGSDEAAELEAADEPYRHSIQLYHHVTRTTPLDGLRVLDIGCGRGGGSDYLLRYRSCETVIGLDYSPDVLLSCRNNHSGARLHFIGGDAETLPFADNAFDAILNVESSHSYDNIAAFLAEVRRVLRPGGHFLFADFRDPGALTCLDERLRQSGMRLVDRTDITPSILAALDVEHEAKLDFIRKAAPRPLVKLFKEFAGCKGSRIYNRFLTGKSVYYSYILQEPDA